MEVQEATGLDLSLAQAFVAFLQDESTPKAHPKLPLKEDLNSSNASSISSGRSTPTSAMPTLGVINPNFQQQPHTPRSGSASPLLFSASTPNSSSFGPSRSSSSILRQVLQEETKPDELN